MIDLDAHNGPFTIFIRAISVIRGQNSGGGHSGHRTGRHPNVAILVEDR
jgi:hypothetical protein